MNVPTKNFSIEVFPAKTPQTLMQLQETCREFSSVQPDFFSVTFGAAGSQQEKTLATVDALLAENLQVAPHLTGIGLKKSQVKELLTHYQQQGIRRLVVIRGDLPCGVQKNEGDFLYANELVTFIREIFSDHFLIYVAAYPEFHPQAFNAQEDFRCFKNKVSQGVDAAFTQFFFNVDAYYFFLEACAKEGVVVPVIPGIMPIANFDRLCHFAQLCGAEIPLWIRKRMTAYGDDAESVRQFGIEVVTKLCEDLLQLNVPGFHFYSLNHIEPTRQILLNLGYCKRSDI